MTENSTTPRSAVPEVARVSHGGHVHTHVHDENCDHDHDPTPVVTYTRGAPKVGRNDVCPCGSGKKYKKCCIAA